jgi:hypothetical protein
MKDILKIPGYMNIFGNIMMIKLKMFLRKEMLDIANRTGQQVVHSHDVIAFPEEAITQV